MVRRRSYTSVKRLLQVARSSEPYMDINMPHRNRVGDSADGTNQDESVTVAMGTRDTVPSFLQRGIDTDRLLKAEYWTAHLGRLKSLQEQHRVIKILRSHMQSTATKYNGRVAAPPRRKSGLQPQKVNLRKLDAARLQLEEFARTLGLSGVQKESCSSPYCLNQPCEQ
jgi:hypothetical protein